MQGESRKAVGVLAGFAPRRFFIDCWGGTPYHSYSLQKWKLVLFHSKVRGASSALHALQLLLRMGIRLKTY